jgi:hypothetical protein
MNGRAFLDVARELEARDALLRWGFSLPPRDRVHATVRLRLLYAKDTVLKGIGAVLDQTGQLRSRADYDLALTRFFTNRQKTQDAVQDIESAILELDRIESDPVRRAAAIASIQP